LKFDKHQQESVIIILGKKIFNKTIFDFEELILIFQHFSVIDKEFEVINKVDYSKVCTKSKRFINRFRQYLEDNKVSLLEALGDIAKACIAEKTQKTFYMCESGAFFGKAAELKIRANSNELPDLFEIIQITKKKKQVDLTKFWGIIESSKTSEYLQSFKTHKREQEDDQESIDSPNTRR
jgi:hypothetical protein